MYTACVITVSDRCFQGEREDKSGPVLKELLVSAGYSVIGTEIVPDEKDQIEAALLSACDKAVNLILTTGGTGFSVRDVTPEATLHVCEKMTPGIPEEMRRVSRDITPKAILSREAAGIRGESLIINLPGSPKAARENLMAVIEPVQHGIDILTGNATDCGRKHS